ncbi:MAG: DsbA family protein [Endomicrobiia bacterium]
MEEKKENKEEKEDVIKIKKDFVYLGVIAILVVALLALISINNFGSIKQPEVNQTKNLQSPNIEFQQEVTRVNVNIEGKQFKGSPDSLVTIVEFSDFKCPFCKRFFDGPYKQLDDKYIKTGKVKFVYRHFLIKQGSENAALAAECAREQNKFWEMHDKLFESSIEWANLADASDKFKQYAEELGLDKEKFNNCYDSKKYLEEIQKDMSDGINYGVQATPSFIIYTKNNLTDQQKENIKNTIKNRFNQYGNFFF